jgi:ribosomal protein S18 acetylase RimI-like enzyme
LACGQTFEPGQFVHMAGTIKNKGVAPKWRFEVVADVQTTAPQRVQIEALFADCFPDIDTSGRDWKDDSTTFYLLSQDELLVSCATVVQQRRRQASVWGVCTLATHRRKGYATKLLRHMQSVWAAGHAQEPLALFVNREPSIQTHDRLVAMYQTLGFRKNGGVRHEQGMATRMKWTPV